MSAVLDVQASENTVFLRLQWKLVLTRTTFYDYWRLTCIKEKCNLVAVFDPLFFNNGYLSKLNIEMVQNRRVKK